MTHSKSLQNNIRMKKILHIIICMLTLSASMAWAGTTVSNQTIWSEDFDNVQGGDISSVSSFSAFGKGGGNFAECVVGDMGLGTAVLCTMGTSGSFMFADFKYDASEITDNWTFSMYIKSSDASCYMKTSVYYFGQLAVTGSNTNPSQGTKLTSGCYLILDKTSDGEDSNGEPTSYYNVKLGDTTVNGQLLLKYGHGYKVTLKCTNYNTTSATLSVIVYDEFEDKQAYESSATVNPAQLGALRGMFEYKYSDYNMDHDPYASIRYYDDFKLTKDVIVDDTPCEAPTYSIVDANLKARTVVLDCETEGAEIYYSETELAPGDNAWLPYAGEFETEATTLYIYAVNPVNGRTSEVITFGTGAGSTLQLYPPTFTAVSYDAEKGFAFTLTPNYDYVAVAPRSPRFYYQIDGGTKTLLAEGSWAYAPPGSTIMKWMEADGYTASRKTNAYTSTRPDYPMLWKQDFTTLVDGSVYGKDAKNVVLSGSSAFDVDGKPIYNIEKFISGGQNVSISVDKRIGLSTASDYYLKADSGLVSTKPTPEFDDDVESADDYFDAYDGLAVSGLVSGQYVYVSTVGGRVLVPTGSCSEHPSSTEDEQVFEVYSDAAFFEIPSGVIVKSVSVYSDTEYVTTNEYGYASYVPTNAISFKADDEVRGILVTKETLSGRFTYADIAETIGEVPAGTPVIISGKPNTTYALGKGYASGLNGSNLLTVSETDIDVTTRELPVYVVDLTTGKLVRQESGVVAAGTVCVLSELQAAEYLDVTIGNSGVLGLVYDKPLNFEEVEDLTAYTITSESLKDDKVTFEYWAVDDIPAETPVILSGTPGASYSILVGQRTEALEYYNYLKGSTTSSYATSSKENAVYMLSGNDSTLVEVDKNAVTTVPAGTIYLVSKYRGFVELTTNESGTLSMTSEYPLDFSESPLTASVMTGETVSSLVSQPVSTVAAGDPFFILKGGEPNTTYRVVKADEGTKTDLTTGTYNRLTSSTADYAVSNNANYIWALNAATGEVERMSEDYVVPAGEAYYISAYERQVELGYEEIVMPSNGVRSYVAQHNLDFATVGLDAYIVYMEGADGTLYPNKLGQVPAGTVVALRGEKGKTYQVPVIESAPEIATNLLTVSETDFVVADQDRVIYMVTGDGYVDFSKATAETVIEAGEAFIISKNVGFEKITIGSSGYLSYYTYNALDFTGIEDIEVRIVTGESINGIFAQTIEKTTKDCGVFIKGVPNKTYVVPVCKLANLGLDNKLRGSHTDPFPVSSVAPHYVYGYSKGNIVKASSSVTFKPNQAYFVSAYGGYETIKTNEYGYVSGVAANDIDFEPVEGLSAYVVIDEYVDSIEVVEIQHLPKGAAFFVKGEPNTEYKIPVRPGVKEITNNILTGSLTNDFCVDDTVNYVYGMSADGKFRRATKGVGVVIPAGKAYFISKYQGYEAITVGSNRYSTYVTEHALDFKEIEDRGLTAFIITGETEKTFDWTWVYEVPANTPIVLSSLHADTTYNVPFSTLSSESWQYKDKNLLRGSLTEDFTVPDGLLVYGMANNKFVKAKYGATFAARKAYVISTLNSSTEAKSALFDGLDNIDMEATAVKEVDINSMEQEHRYYNLSGQPVDDDYKGIVIDERGRKYLRE